MSTQIVFSLFCAIPPIGQTTWDKNSLFSVLIHVHLCKYVHKKMSTIICNFKNNRNKCLKIEYWVNHQCLMKYYIAIKKNMKNPTVCWTVTWKYNIIIT